MVREARACLCLFLLVGIASACSRLLKNDQDDFGPHCRFSGSESTACGICIAEQCQAIVDDLCSDKAKAQVLDAIDLCAGGKQVASCEALAKGAGLEGAEGQLGSCIGETCRQACFEVEQADSSVDAGEDSGKVDSGLDGSEDSGSSGKVACATSAKGCDCFRDQPYNEVECSTSTVKDAACCADNAWPSEHSQCKCRPVGCAQGPTECTCSSATDPMQTTCTGGHCCKIDEWCECGGDACDAWGAHGVEVSSCSFKEVGCAQGTKKVDSCSRF